MGNVIFEDEKMFGRVQDVASYFIKEITSQYEDDEIDSELFWSNARVMIDTLAELKEIEEDTYIEVKELAMGGFSVKVLKEEEKDFVYVLREDLYNEWAWENGASNLICICDNLKTLEQKLKEQLVKEVEESDERILEFSSWKVGNMQSIGAMTKYAIDELYCGIDEIHILVYGNKEDYDNGKDNANIVISKVKIEK